MSSEVMIFASYAFSAARSAIRRVICSPPRRSHDRLPGPEPGLTSVGKAGPATPDVVEHPRPFDPEELMTTADHGIPTSGAVAPAAPDGGDEPVVTERVWVHRTRRAEAAGGRIKTITWFRRSSGIKVWMVARGLRHEVAPLGWINEFRPCRGLQFFGSFKEVRGVRDYGSILLDGDSLISVIEELALDPKYKLISQK